MTVDHSLFLRLIIAGFMEKILRFKTQKWRREFSVFSWRCHRWVSGASVVYLLILSAGVFIISFGLLQESSSLFFVGFIVVVKEIYTTLACDIGDTFWTYNLCFLQLADRCFSLHYDSKTFFSLSLRLVPATDTFIMLVMVFSPIGLVWTRCLNFRFRLLLR